MNDFDPGALEAERDFLLRSLDDLEAEREAGNVDDGTYQKLRDDYTARAAAAIRSLADGKDLTPPDPPAASRLARGATVGGVVVFALVAAFVLTGAVGQRRPGQTITGNSQIDKSGTTAVPDPGPALAAEVRANPKSYAANIAYARYFLFQKNDFTDAIHEFGTAAQLDPSQPEPPTYAGWAGALLAEEVKVPNARNALLAASIERISEVIKAHPKYPDAYALKGVILFDFEHDPKQAIPQLQASLVLTNDSNPIRSQVLAVLAQAVNAVKGTGASK
ncbi:MAG: tetratricopeptide repeat protein [Acidimicrobiia bacterium]